MLGMYLARRRTVLPGIYQATDFGSKPAGRAGLKIGGYFLTLEACEQFEQHFWEHQGKKANRMASSSAAAEDGLDGLAHSSSPAARRYRSQRSLPPASSSLDDEEEMSGADVSSEKEKQGALADSTASSESESVHDTADGFASETEPTLEDEEQRMMKLQRQAGASHKKQERSSIVEATHAAPAGAAAGASLPNTASSSIAVAEVTPRRASDPSALIQPLNAASTRLSPPHALALSSLSTMPLTPTRAAIASTALAHKPLLPHIPLGSLLSPQPKLHLQGTQPQVTVQADLTASPSSAQPQQNTTDSTEATGTQPA
jgi:hypothetical protein